MNRTRMGEEITYLIANPDMIDDYANRTKDMCTSLTWVTVLATALYIFTAFTMLYSNGASLPVYVIAISIAIGFPIVTLSYIGKLTYQYEQIVEGARRAIA